MSRCTYILIFSTMQLQCCHLLYVSLQQKRHLDIVAERWIEQYNTHANDNAAGDESSAQENVLKFSSQPM